MENIIRLKPKPEHIPSLANLFGCSERTVYAALRRDCKSDLGIRIYNHVADNIKAYNAKKITVFVY